MMCTYGAACVRTIYYTSTHNVVYIRISFPYTAPHEGQNKFLSFSKSCFEAPQLVLFHGTAVHFHHGRDIEDATFFVLECVCPKF